MRIRASGLTILLKWVNNTSIHCAQHNKQTNTMSNHPSNFLADTKNVIVCSNGWIEKLAEDNKRRGSLSQQPRVPLDTLAYTVYSSGTTGKPKGTHGTTARISNSQSCLTKWSSIDEVKTIILVAISPDHEVNARLSRMHAM